MDDDDAIDFRFRPTWETTSTKWPKRRQSFKCANIYESTWLFSVGRRVKVLFYFKRFSCWFAVQQACSVLLVNQVSFNIPNGDLVFCVIPFNRSTIKIV